MNGIDYVKDKEGQTLAITIRRIHKAEEYGIKFLTDPSEPLQLANMLWPMHKEVERHEHNPVPRKTVVPTAEVLIVKKGFVHADVYDNQYGFVECVILEAGDVFLQLRGGHGFRFISEAEVIEVKSGPYMGEKDKTRF